TPSRFAAQGPGEFRAGSADVTPANRRHAGGEPPGGASKAGVTARAGGLARGGADARARARRHAVEAACAVVTGLSAGSVIRRCNLRAERLAERRVLVGRAEAEITIAFE